MMMNDDDDESSLPMTVAREVEKRNHNVKLVWQIISVQCISSSIKKNRSQEVK